MSELDEIERLRAGVIVTGALLQAIFEELPLGVLENIQRNAAFKLEHFTVRTLNSQMPEAFVEAQKQYAVSWSSQLEEILVRRRGNSTTGAGGAPAA